MKLAGVFRELNSAYKNSGNYLWVIKCYTMYLASMNGKWKNN